MRRREEDAASRRVVDQRPELFSIADLPKELFDWDALLRSERKFSHHGPLSTEVDPELFYQRRQLLALFDGGNGPGAAMQYPHPASQAFLDRCREIFCLIDVRERGVVDERFLEEIHDTFGAPVPSGVQGRGGVEEDPHRPRWCRAMVVQILSHSGRLDALRTSSDGALIPVESLPRGSLNLKFDEFCRFLAALAQQ